MVSLSNHTRVIYSVATRLNGGGIGTTSFNAVKGIYDAQILGRVYCTSNGQSHIPPSFISSTNVSIFERLPFLPSSFQWLLKDAAHDLIVASMLRSIEANSFDIFHVWNGHGLYSMIKAKKLGAKIVVERASSHPLTYERILNEELKIRGANPQKLLAINKKRLLAELMETDYITVPSDFSYQSMVENGVAAEKLVKLSFGVDTEYFRPSNKAHEGFNVLFVGQVGFRKGVLYLLEAWKKLGLKDAKLRLLGQEDSEIKPFLTPFRNDPSIEFLGYGNSLELYQNSDVFILPSLEEGSALVTYEALACGLPLIVTRETGSVVEDGQEGFIVPSGDVDVLAEKIRFLYDNQTGAKEMGHRSRAKAKLYSWTNYGTKLVESYKKIL